jgi:UDP-N-acetylmuramoylalanine--D-glutamate ligase
MIASCDYLLLGAGKVSGSVARAFPGKCLSLTEKENELQLLKWSADSSDWKLIQSFPGSFDEFDFASIEFRHLVLSPGISTRRSFFKFDLRRKEVRELDLFKRQFRGRTFVVTGTNGKSTATFQLGQVFERLLSAPLVFVGGNLGTPALDWGLFRPLAKWAVLEVSSYQAERLTEAEFDFGLLLNLSPDHLNRYESLNDYYQAKWDLLSRCRHVFYPDDLKPPANIPKSAIVFHSSDSWESILRKIVEWLSQEISFPNHEYTSETLLRDLKRLPHRLESLFCDLSYSFINDSKATNVCSLMHALSQTRSFSRRHLVLGGIAKGDDFSLIKSQLVPEDQIWIYGQDRFLIEGQLVDLEQKRTLFDKLGDLLDEIFKNLKSGDLVLLSPGCASFDQFIDFEDRGRFFANKVQDFLNTQKK